MGIFSDRENAQEAKFAFDAENNFNAEARRNRLFANWVSDKMAITDEAKRNDYVKEVARAALREAGDSDIITKVIVDLTAAGVEIDETVLRAKLSELDAKVRAELS